MKTGFIALRILALPAICKADQTIIFNRDVRPILSDRCFHCHGPNEQDRQADLRLDQAEGPDGRLSRPRRLTGHQTGVTRRQSVWYRITTEDDDVMPPPDSPKNR